MIHNSPEKSSRLVTASLLLAALSMGTMLLFLFKIHALERELAKERKAAAAGMAEQDAVNRKLAKELALLNDQATLTQWHMAELERMEREVRRLANRARLVASLTGMQPAGAGGQYLAYDAPETPDDPEAVRARFVALLEQAHAMRDSYRETLSTVSGLDELLRQTPILWPTDARQINSGFGYRRDPFSGQAAHHNGVDIDGEKGDPVYAAADGIIKEAGSNGAHGLQIIIEHNEQYTTVYSHLSRILAESGQIVRQGDLIGEIGTSGRSTGPHLHYEVLLDGTQVDPRDYLLIGRDEVLQKDRSE